MDRCIATARAFRGRIDVLGIEIGETSEIYSWGNSGQCDEFEKITLFRGRTAESVGEWERFRACFAALRRSGATDVFVSGYQRPYGFALALLCRLTGRSVYVMLDSKFDDKPRRLAVEWLKSLLMLPYRGGFASGRRAEEYLRLLGLRRRPVSQGYDAVSIARLKALAREAPLPWEQRPFLAVARFVPKKNLSLALRAYAGYCRQTAAPRRLRLCGGGVLEAELRAEAEALGIAGRVDFLGFQPQETIASEMASALCLLLPSREEQWGLVVNEALAFDLPVLASTNVGAVDALVSPLDNGFALDPDDAEAWTRAMLLVATDRNLWERFAEGSRRRAPLGDTAAFVRGVADLLGLEPEPAGPSRLPR